MDPGEPHLPHADSELEPLVSSENKTPKRKRIRKHVSDPKVGSRSSARLNGKARLQRQERARVQLQNERKEGEQEQEEEEEEEEEEEPVGVTTITTEDTDEEAKKLVKQIKRYKAKIRLLELVQELETVKKQYKEIVKQL